MTRPAKLLLLATSVAAVVVGLVAIAGGGWPSQASEGATITIRYSRFEPALVTARAGEPIAITLSNADPIEHEWIVGAAAVHERHRSGTEPYHDHLPTEVTVPALSSHTTVVVFEEPGDYAFICHLPGHEAYGMRGTLRVE